MSKVIDLVNEAIKMLGREELYAELTDVEKYKKITGITWITEEMLADESLEDKLCWLVPGGAAYCDGKTCKVMTEEEVKEFIESLKDGGEIKVSANMTTTTITLSKEKETSLDLAGNTITTVREESDEYGDGITIPTGGKATISGGKIDNLSAGPAGAAIMVKGTADVTLEDVDVITNGFPVYLTGAGKATIKSGTYKAANSTAAVYINKEGGKVVIEGGRFESMNYNGKNYCLNLNDKIADGDKHIEVRGGEFVNFDPMHSDAEPGGDYNLVADGYVSGYYVSGNDKIYIVVEDPGDLPDMSVVDGKEIYWSSTRLGNNAGVEPVDDAEDGAEDTTEDTTEPIADETPVVEETEVKE